MVVVVGVPVDGIVVYIYFLRVRSLKKIYSRKEVVFLHKRTSMRMKKLLY